MPDFDTLVRAAGVLLVGCACYGLGRLDARRGEKRRYVAAYECGREHGAAEARAAFIAVLEGRHAISRAYARTRDLERLPARRPVDVALPPAHEGD